MHHAEDNMREDLSSTIRFQRDSFLHFLVYFSRFFFLASIELPTKWPVFKDTDDALTRLTLTERVMIIPRAPGNIANGEAVYQKKCATCHAKNGSGRGMFPMLVGQYTSYLKRQIEKYLKNERPHDDTEVGGILTTLKEDDVQDVLAYLTSIQEQP